VYRRGLKGRCDMRSGTRKAVNPKQASRGRGPGQEKKKMG